jgi:3-hydroxyisobutyrate dehydrogenase
MKVGYIGLGSMGRPLARQLIGKYELHVWDISATACAEFREMGARVMPTAAALARQCDAVLLCLPRTENVRQVTFGPEGLVEGLAPGTVVIDQTSGVPEETRDIARKLASHGVSMLDAPVAGGVPAAEAGKITIMVSGPEDTYEKVANILRTISSNVFRCGERVGDGQTIKLANNVMNAVCRFATLEAVTMGRKLGVPLKTLTELLNQSIARNRITQTVLPALLEGRPATNFALPLMVKDVTQAIKLGTDAGAPMPLSSIALGLLQIGVNILGRDARLEDVPRLVETLAGTRLADDPYITPLDAQSASDAFAAESDQLVVGFVGLDARGAAPTQSLTRVRNVRVFDDRRELVQKLVAEGAIAVPDLPSLARECDVIVICVSDPAALREVMFGSCGLAEGLAAGKIVIDQTTGDPIAARRMAAELEGLGVALVDASVVGDHLSAAAVAATTLYSGPPEACVRVRPILQRIGPDVTYCGGSGNAQAAMLVTNALEACNRSITYETLAMGIKNGLKLADIETIINHGSGWSATFERIVAALVSDERLATKCIATMLKDLRLVVELAASSGAPMLIANAVHGMLEAAANELGGEANIDELVRHFEVRAGTSFVAS